MKYLLTLFIAILLATSCTQSVLDVEVLPNHSVSPNKTPSFTIPSIQFDPFIGDWMQTVPVSGQELALWRLGVPVDSVYTWSFAHPSTPTALDIPQGICTINSSTTLTINTDDFTTGYSYEWLSTTDSLQITNDDVITTVLVRQ